MKKILSLNLEDVSQIIVGAFVLAVPISFSEEAWRLGESLETLNLLLIVALSFLFLTLFTYQSVFQSNVKTRYFEFILRILIAYFISMLVVALVLTSLGKFPLVADTAIALKRLLIISMPASMGAIVVDGFDKE